MPSEPFELKPEPVSVDQLFLDPANPRLASVDTTPDVNEATFDDCYAFQQATQSDLREKLRQDRSGFSDLVNKIRSQGFLPIDRIVVRPAASDDPSVTPDAGGYVVLEGNRRVAALKTILASPTVNLLSPPIRGTLDPIEVLVYEGDDPQVAWKIQGLRHIQGVREWGAYQRAKYLHDMLATQGVDVEDLHEATGYRVSDVNRYVNSYYGFRQARDLRSDVGESDFSIFQEAVFASGVAGRSLSEWLGWDPDANQFDNEANLTTLLELLNEDEDGGEPKISGALELRNRFAKLLAEPFAAILALFLAGELTLEEADSRRKEQAAAATAVQDEAALDARRTALEDAYNNVDSLPIGKIRRAGKGPEFVELLSALGEVATDTIGLLGEADRSSSSPSVPNAQ